MEFLHDAAEEEEEDEEEDDDSSPLGEATAAEAAGDVEDPELIPAGGS